MCKRALSRLPSGLGGPPPLLESPPESPTAHAGSEPQLPTAADRSAPSPTVADGVVAIDITLGGATAVAVG
eukprot:10851896-Alexandrium_andersonii.AAC.1